MKQLILSAVTGSLLLATPTQAAPTDVVVRVISEDAKFVGSSMGGAEVSLRDAASGAMLARGITEGGTGDTERIMAATGRSPARATPDAAAFRATLDIERPTLVRVEIRGPLGFPGTMQGAASERWIVPGQPTAGDGWVVELPGLAIRADPPAPAAAKVGVSLPLRFHVQLMCGCPITPGGLWDAADYAVTAEVRQSGRPAQAVPLAFVAAPGRYGASWTPGARGPAELTIVATNRRTGNTGVLVEKIDVQ